MIKAIETVYKGYRFRSRAEARWAVFFDNAGIKWMYEPEGFKLSDGTMYLPDFYLPEMDCFFEVKGVMTAIDEHKIDQFIHDAQKAVVVGDGNMEFVACDCWEGYQDELYTRGEDGDISYLIKCRDCGKLYFSAEQTSPCCRYCCNDRYEVQLCGRMDDDEEKGWVLPMDYARYAALQARFEHGESPLT